MKIVGLITEYNPFHNGHLYHMQEAVRATKADAVIAVMSGDFVQRGAPALLPKHLRARMALEAGVSAVIELPLWCACGSAEYFAAGAISLLDRLGCVDTVCFGSECGDIRLLEKAARVTALEPEPYKSLLKEGLRRGLSFPGARQQALSSFLGDEEAGCVLEEPNNILGVEYIKAILCRRSPLQFCTIRRRESGYHDQELSGRYSSATAIRRLLLEKEGCSSAASGLSLPEGQMPPSSAQILQETYRARYPVWADDLSLLLKYRLLQETKESLTRYADVNRELANRIMGSRNDFLSFDQFCSLLKTKEMTYSRISRALLHILLGITREDMARFKGEGGCGYARLLGFRKDASSLLGAIKKSSSIPLVTKLPRTGSRAGTGQSAKAWSGLAGDMLRADILAADLYESVVTEKFHRAFVSEYRQQVVIV